MTNFEEWYAPLKWWQGKLDCCDYQPALNESELQDLKDEGLTIFYGQSDDLLEAEGAFFEEFGAWEGVTVKFEKGFVKAEWTGGEPNWVITTDVPHVMFTIIEEGMVYCRGVIVHQEDLGKYITDYN